VNLGDIAMSDAYMSSRLRLEGVIAVGLMLRPVERRGWGRVLFWRQSAPRYCDSQSRSKPRSSAVASLALKEERSLLPWNQPPLLPAEGDPGGGAKCLGDPGRSPNAAAAVISKDEVARGDDRPAPVLCGTWRSSSSSCAKKQMRRAQAAPSLQSLVRYCVGWSQLSNTPCENSQLSPLGQPPGRRKLGQGTAV